MHVTGGAGRIQAQPGSSKTDIHHGPCVQGGRALIKYKIARRLRGLVVWPGVESWCYGKVAIMRYEAHCEKVLERARDDGDRKERDTNDQP